jgi:hypothetical protein
MIFHAYGHSVQSLPDSDVLRRPPATPFHLITVADDVAVYRIDTLQLWVGWADSRDTAEALAGAAEHQADLYARWHECSE